MPPPAPAPPPLPAFCSGVCHRPGGRRATTIQHTSARGLHAATATAPLCLRTPAPAAQPDTRPIPATQPGRRAACFDFRNQLRSRRRRPGCASRRQRSTHQLAAKRGRRAFPAPHPAICAAGFSKHRLRSHHRPGGCASRRQRAMHQRAAKLGWRASPAAHPMQLHSLLFHDEAS